MDTDSRDIGRKTWRVPYRARGTEAEKIGFIHGLGSGVVSVPDFLTVMEIFEEKALHIVVNGDRCPSIGMQVAGAGPFDALVAVPASLVEIVPGDYVGLTSVDDFLLAGQSMADDMERQIVIRRSSGKEAVIVDTFYPATVTMH